MREVSVSTQSSTLSRKTPFVGNDRVLFGIIFGFTVSITAPFSGIFIVVVGSLADWFGRVEEYRRVVTLYGPAEHPDATVQHTKGDERGP